MAGRWWQRLWVVLLLAAGARAQANEAHLIECHEGENALVFDSGGGREPALTWQWTHDGTRSSGVAALGAAVRGKSGWHVTLGAGEARSNATPTTKRRARGESQLLIVDGDAASSLSFSQPQPSSWSACRVDAARLQALAPTPKAPKCTSAEVKGRWLAEVKGEGGAGGTAQALDYAQALCELQAGRVAAESQLAVAMTNLMLELDARGGSSSRSAGVFSVPAALAGARAKCEEVLRAANTCHNIQCATAATEIATTCAKATAKMAGEM